MATKYKVVCNKYSHEGSGFGYIESLHDTQEQAEAHATIIKPLHRFVRVEEATEKDQIYGNS